MQRSKCEMPSASGSHAAREGRNNNNYNNKGFSGFLKRPKFYPPLPLYAGGGTPRHLADGR